ncbi:LacI family DNA-binding transcriptional regulator [Micromonospora sp. CPCC 206061]|uniref:LacI family DNA-binding transcriptional regulator n=1 Tax=Micromonospora sp. CPCC 206061 TaxID=3122410 RepID=UPI002FF2A972
MGRRPTVYDVAARAGVSIATVSFVFTQPDRVRKSTREAVLAAAGDLGYVPSASARGLAKGRTGAIGLYTFDYLLDSVPSGPPARGPGIAAETDIRRFPLYVDEVQWGVELECRQRGYALMLGAGHNPGNLPAVIDIAGRVDGLIAFAGSAPPEAIIQVARRIPVVELGGEARAEGVYTVLVDNRTGMRELTEHLLVAHGLRRMVYLGERGTPEFRARYDGFADALTAHGLPVPEPVRSHPSDDPSTIAAVRPYIESGALPDVFVCATDQEALVAIDTLRAAGVDVPGGVAVTGFDGTVAARLATPRLTTVRQPMEEVGRTAVRILAGVLADATPPDEPGVLSGADALNGAAGADRAWLPTTFVRGSSCGCVATV